MENSVRAIIIAAAVVITIALATIGFMVLSSGQETARTALSKMGEMNTQLYESDYLMYEKDDISGSEVVNAVYKFKNHKLSIIIDTLKNSTDEVYIYSLKTTGDEKNALNSPLSNAISDITDQSSDEYVNPNGRFTGTIIRDKNEVITGIEFEQQN